MIEKSIITIHNQDANNLHYSVKEPLSCKHIDSMVDNIAASGVDVALINSNTEVANHPSAVLGTYEDMFDGDPAKSAPSNIPQDFWDVFANDYRQYKILKSQGCDYLKHALQRCKQKDLSPGISVRMNDMHGGNWENSPTHSLFFKEHPEYRIMIGDSCRGLNYVCKAVRTRMIDYIRELYNNYDFDFLELDWLRFYTHFYPGEGFKNRNIITEFMAEVRDILKNITLIVRVNQNPASALDSGLDIASWAKSGLVDIISPCSFFSLRLDASIEEYRRLTEDQVKIFGCFDDTMQGRKTMLEQTELSRGAIAGVIASGAQGVEFFNQFPINKDDPIITLRGKLLKEMHQSATFQALPKEFRVEEKPFCWKNTVDFPWQLPEDISWDNTKKFSFLMAKPAEKTVAKIQIIYNQALNETDKWYLYVNEYPVGHPDEILKSNKAVFYVSACFFKMGKNQLLVGYNAEAPATIKSIIIKCD